MPILAFDFFVAQLDKSVLYGEGERSCSWGGEGRNLKEEERGNRGRERGYIRGGEGWNPKKRERGKGGGTNNMEFSNTVWPKARGQERNFEQLTAQNN